MDDELKAEREAHDRWMLRSRIPALGPGHRGPGMCERCRLRWSRDDATPISAEVVLSARDPPVRYLWDSRAVGSGWRLLTPDGRAAATAVGPSRRPSTEDRVSAVHEARPEGNGGGSSEALGRPPFPDGPAQPPNPSRRDGAGSKSDCEGRTVDAAELEDALLAELPASVQLTVRYAIPEPYGAPTPPGEPAAPALPDSASNGVARVGQTGGGGDSGMRTLSTVELAHESWAFCEARRLLEDARAVPSPEECARLPERLRAIATALAVLRIWGPHSHWEIPLVTAVRWIHAARDSLGCSSPLKRLNGMAKGFDRVRRHPRFHPHGWIAPPSPEREAEQQDGGVVPDSHGDPIQVAPDGEWTPGEEDAFNLSALRADLPWWRERADRDDVDAWWQPSSVVGPPTRAATAKTDGCGATRYVVAQWRLVRPQDRARVQTDTDASGWADEDDSKEEGDDRPRANVGRSLFLSAPPDRFGRWHASLTTVHWQNRRESVDGTYGGASLGWMRGARLTEWSRRLDSEEVDLLICECLRNGGGLCTGPVLTPFDAPQHMAPDVNLDPETLGVVREDFPAFLVFLERIALLVGYMQRKVPDPGAAPAGSPSDAHLSVSLTPKASWAFSAAKAILRTGRSPLRARDWVNLLERIPRVREALSALSYEHGEPASRLAPVFGLCYTRSPDLRFRSRMMMARLDGFAEALRRAALHPRFYLDEIAPIEYARLQRLAPSVFLPACIPVLPHALLSAALGRIGCPRDLLAAGLCCREWARAAFDDSLWRGMLPLLSFGDAPHPEEIPPGPVRLAFARTAAPVRLLLAVDRGRANEPGTTRGCIELWIPRWVRLVHLRRWWRREFADPEDRQPRSAETGPRRSPAFAFAEREHRARLQSWPSGSLYDCIGLAAEAVLHVHGCGPSIHHWMDKVAAWAPDCSPAGPRSSPQHVLRCKADAARRFRGIDLDPHLPPECGADEEW